jgi:hypothetical protein
LSCSNIFLTKENYMKKLFLAGPFGSAAGAGAMLLLCIALSGLTGCGEDALQSGENKITAFAISGVSGSIKETDQEISIDLSEDAEVDLTKAVPEIAVSENASVSPASGVEVDISQPINYTVTAENGATRSYVVKAVKKAAPVLRSISVTPLKTNYAYDEEPDWAADILVTGSYSDGTSKIEAVKTDENPDGYVVSGYDKEKSGRQTILVTLGGTAAAFTVDVGYQPGNISVSIGLPNKEQQPEIFGIPEGGIKLSTSQKDLPHKIIISSAAANYAVYSSVRWYVDGTSKSSDNIITIEAENYTLKIPHYITFIGTRDGVEYSRTIEFTVAQ